MKNMHCKFSIGKIVRTIGLLISHNDSVDQPQGRDNEPLD